MLLIRRFRTQLSLALLIILLALATTLSADTVKKGIFLVTADGSKTPIGQISLTEAQKTGFSIKVRIDETRFDDHFLSMRPFKCISNESSQLCHQPYPYENRRIISANDMADLEYDLLFIRRSPSDYGINPWFGVYYKMNWSGKLNDPIEGTLHETNMDLLVSPPEQGNYRPIPADELHEADLSQHHWPHIKIH